MVGWCVFQSASLIRESHSRSLNFCRLFGMLVNRLLNQYIGIEGIVFLAYFRRISFPRISISTHNPITLIRSLSDDTENGACCYPVCCLFERSEIALVPPPQVLV